MPTVTFPVGPYPRCNLGITAEHGDWIVKRTANGQTMFASRDADSDFPGWMRKDIYLWCCFLFLGTPYRLLFNFLVPQVSFSLRKRIQTVGPASQAPCQDDDAFPLND